MTDAISQARALQDLIGRDIAVEAIQPTVDAVIRCCTDLIEGGEAPLALGLIQATLDKPIAARASRVRLETARVRALTSARREEEALQLSRRLVIEYSDYLMPGT